MGVIVGVGLGIGVCVGVCDGAGVLVIVGMGDGVTIGVEARIGLDTWQAGRITTIAMIQSNWLEFLIFITSNFST